MLSRFPTYKVIMLLLCLVLFVWAIIVAVPIAITSVLPNGGSQQFTFLILDSPGLALNLIIHRGTFWYVVVGLFFLCFGLQKPRVSYWSIQLTIWLVSISIWYQLISSPYPPPTLWIVVTILCSLILLLFYKPVLSGIQKAMMVPKKLSSE